MISGHVFVLTNYHYLFHLEINCFHSQVIHKNKNAGYSTFDHSFKIRSCRIIPLIAFVHGSSCSSSCPMQIYGNSYKPNKKQLSVIKLSLVYLLMMKTENFFLFNYLHFKEKCEKKSKEDHLLKWDQNLE